VTVIYAPAATGAVGKIGDAACRVGETQRIGVAQNGDDETLVQGYRHAQIHRALAT
jgi:hypothetical protein